MFQMLGCLYGQCGCSTVKEFVEKMKESEKAQFELFVNYLKNSPKMVDALKNHDWKNFAKLYNGPSYAINHYDEKLSKAYSSLKNQ